MEAFLRALYAVIPGWLRPVAAPVIDRLLAVWRWSQSLAVRVRGGWQRVNTGTQRLRDGLERLGGATYDTLRWLTQVRVPALARWSRDAAIRWARDRVQELRVAVGSVRTLAIRAVSALRAEALAWLSALRRWVAGLVGPVLSAVGRLLTRVFDTWATPARMAAWLAGAMWSALWHYAYSNIDRFAEALWSRRRRLTLRTIDEITQIVRHVL